MVHLSDSSQQYSEPWLHSITWINFTLIILGKRNQTWKSTCYMVLFMSDSKMSKINIQVSTAATFWGREEKTRRLGEWRWGPGGFWGSGDVLEQGFSTLALLTSWSGPFFAVMYTASFLASTHWVQVANTPSSSCDNQQCLQTLPVVPGDGGQNSPGWGPLFYCWSWRIMLVSSLYENVLSCTCRIHQLFCMHIKL